METKNGTAQVVEPKPSPVQTKISQLSECSRTIDQLLLNLDELITTLNYRLESVLNPNKLITKCDKKKGELNKETALCPLCAQLDSLIDYNNISAEKILAIKNRIEDIISVLDI